MLDAVGGVADAAAPSTPTLKLAGRIPFAHDDAGDDATAGQAPSLIVSLAVSRDGQWCAASGRDHRVLIFSLDALQIHCVLPRFVSPPTAMAFHPTKPLVCVALASRHVYAFDVESRRFSDWSKRNSDRLPASWRQVHEIIVNIDFDPSEPDRILLQDSMMLSIIDTRYVSVLRGTLLRLSLPGAWW